MTQERLETLAERCEAAAGLNRELNCDIAMATGIRPQFRDPAALGFTGSLDAAMALMPEGCVPVLDWHHKATDAPGVVSFEAYVQTIAYAKTLGSGEAISHALALCAAALRARQALSQERAS